MEKLRHELGERILISEGAISDEVVDLLDTIDCLINVRTVSMEEVEWISDLLYEAASLITKAQIFIRRAAFELRWVNHHLVPPKAVIKEVKND